MDPLEAFEDIFTTGQDEPVDSHDLAPIEGENPYMSPPEDSIRSVDLDKQIACHLQAITRLKVQRNDDALINRTLPGEVLVHIFSLCGSEPDDLTWIQVTYVCRYWRQLALDYPLLWSKIGFRKPKWALEMLKRSKAAPLRVHAELSRRFLCYESQIEAFKVFWGHMSHTRELHFHGVLGPVFSIVGDFAASETQNLSTPAPLLEVLFLQNRSTLPNLVVFDHEFPKLRVLTLSGCIVAWDSPILASSITSFTLDMALHRHQIQLEDSKAVLTALQRMPALQQLDLSFSYTTHAMHGFTSLVSLPQLQSFSFTGNFDTCRTFLPQLKYPFIAHTCLDLDYDTGPMSPDAFTGFLSALEMSRKPPHGWPQFVLGLQGHEAEETECGIEVSLWTVEAFRDPGRRTPDVLELRFAHRVGSPPQLYSPLVQICRLFASSTVSIDLAQDLGLAAEILSEAFETMHSVVAVSVRGEVNTLEFIKAMCMNAESYAVSRDAGLDPDKPCVFLPMLKYASFRGGNFCADTGSYASPKIYLLEWIQNTSMLRCECDTQLWKLTLEDCIGLDEQTVLAIRDIVVHVDWDGVEQGFEDEESSEEYGDEDDDLYDSDLEYY